MTPEQIERVFGRGRLKMATGEHVEVFREAVRPGERRRYTKRFLETGDADFRQWTEREWRILARLIGHGIRCVPGVVRFDGDDEGGMRQVQTYDAGVTVDQWATLLPVGRNGTVLRNVFQDCAHWWALAHHCIAALEEIHALSLVHLDIKADNICIPYAPTSFDPDSPDVRLHVTFNRLALIDFAFSLVSKEALATPLPIGWQKDYDYQSPRLLVALEAGRAGDLQPTQDLDWRCDLYSLAAMLRRYLPDEMQVIDGGECGWTAKRHDSARSLVFRLRECHDRAHSIWRPHRELMEITSAHIAEPDLASSLTEGWTLARNVEILAAPSLVTPLTRIAMPLQTADVAVAPLVTAATIIVPAVYRTPRARPTPVVAHDVAANRAGLKRNVARPAALALLALVAIASPAFVGNPAHPLADQAREAIAGLRSWISGVPAPANEMMASADSGAPPLSGAGRDGVASSTNARSAGGAEAPTSEQGAAADAASSAPEAPPAETAAAPTEASPQAEAPAAAAPAPTESKPATFAYRQSAKARGKKGQAKPPAFVPQPPQVAHNAPPAKDAKGSRVAIESPKTRHDLASNASSARPPRAPAPVVARSSTVPQQVAVASQPATVSPPAPSADTPSSTTPIEVASAAPTAQQAVPAVQPHATADSSERAVETRPLASTPPPSSAAPVAPSKPPPTNVASASPPQLRSVEPRPRDAWQETFHEILKAFGVKEQRAAPVEERNTRSSSSVAEAPRAPPRPAQAAAPAPQPATTAPAPAATAPAPAMSPPAWTPQETPPAAINPAPRAVPPPRMMAAVEDTDDLNVRAKRMLSDAVPRVAAQARADASNVLWMASVADHPTQSVSVANAAHGPWNSEQLYLLGPRDPVRARQFYDDAKFAFKSGRMSEALDLGMRAFASDPRDSNIAGFLAVLYLSMQPPQPETARQLALHALAFSGSRRSVRADDWDTLAIASALTGRETDATRAFLVELAVTPNLERSCDTIQRAYATFGEPLRVPVQTMSARIRAQRRDNESPACNWLNYQSLQTARKWQ